MEQLTAIQTSLLVTFTAVYLFVFREATKTVVSWGAFEFQGRTDLFFKKLVLVSLVFLVLLPLGMYPLFAKVVIGVKVGSPKHMDLLRELSAAGLLIALLGLFPFACKHSWLLIAKGRARRGRGSAEPGAVWIKSSIQSIDELPRDVYSYQVIVLLGVAPIAILLYVCWSGGMSMALPWNVWEVLFFGAYVSQGLILAHIGQQRRYFYRDPYPKWLISRRMLLTVPVSMILPAAFGIVWYAWVLGLRRGWHPLAVVGLLAALPFPFYCHQSLLILAKKLEWVRREEDPEVFEAAPWVWYVCVVLAVVCLAVLAQASVSNREALFHPFAQHISDMADQTRCLK